MRWTAAETAAVFPAVGRAAGGNFQEAANDGTPFDPHRAAVTEPEDFRYAGTGHGIKFFLVSFSFKKKKQGGKFGWFSAV